MNALSKLPSPIGMDKQEIINVLLKEEYGYLPARPYSVTATLEKRDKLR